MSAYGQWIRPARRLAIYLRDDFRCVYCERDLRDVGERGITLEHVIPRSKGGSNRDDNLVTSCLPCNSSRQNARLPRAVWLRVRSAARMARAELKTVKECWKRLGSLRLAHQALRDLGRRAA